jgi:hypothetical protein
MELLSRGNWTGFVYKTMLLTCSEQGLLCGRSQLGLGSSYKLLLWNAGTTAGNWSKYCMAQDTAGCRRRSGLSPDRPVITTVKSL